MGARCSLIHLVRTCDMKAPCKLGHIESPVAIVRRLQVYTSTRAIFVYWVACLCDRSGIYQPYSPILGPLLHSKSWTRQPTMCVNSYWIASSNSCLCARTKWWLMPSPKAFLSDFCRALPDNDWSCFLRCSTPTLRRRLILSADFERCVFHSFRLICLHFFLPFYVTSSGFELRLIIFSASSFTIFFMFSQFFIFLVCPILSL